MSLWVPFRWGVLEAVRSVRALRLAAALGLGLASLGEVWLRPTWPLADLLAGLGLLLVPGLAFGGAPPSGSAMPRRADRAWASLWGGLVHAALSAALTAALLPAAIMLRDRQPLGARELLELMVVLGSFGAAVSLLAGALRLLMPRYVLGATLLSPVALAAVVGGVEAFGPGTSGFNGSGGNFAVHTALVLAAAFVTHALASVARPPAPLNS